MCCYVHLSIQAFPQLLLKHNCLHRYDKRVAFKSFSVDSAIIYLGFGACHFANSDRFIEFRNNRNLSFLLSISKVFLPLLCRSNNKPYHLNRFNSCNSQTKGKKRTFITQAQEDEKKPFKSMQAKAKKGSTFRTRFIQLYTINKENEGIGG